MRDVTLPRRVKELEKALRLARQALGGYRVDQRSHAEWVAEDVLPAIDRALLGQKGTDGTR